MAGAPPVEFGQAVLPHLDAAYNLARWLVRDPTLAEDVVQDAAVRALGYFSSFHGGDARAWLLRIVRNVAYDTLAGGRRTVAGEPGPELPDPAPDPEAVLARQQGEAQLARILSDLQPELRECLVLKELEGLSYKEIASVTGVPIGTVMSRLWRARQALANGALDRSATQ